MGKLQEYHQILKRKIERKEVNLAQLGSLKYALSRLEIVNFKILIFLIAVLLILFKHSAQGFEVQATRMDNGTYLASFTSYKKLQRRARATSAAALLFLVATLISITIYFPGGWKAALAVCVTPTDNMDITADTELCAGTFNINDAGDDGVINITANSVTLTCSGTVLLGTNNVGTGIGINAGLSGVTVTGCTVQDYADGISVGENSTNISITNNTLHGNVNGIKLDGNQITTPVTNATISGNTSYDNQRGFLIRRANNNTIINNNTTINNMSANNTGMELEDASSNTISGNTLSYNRSGNPNTQFGLYLQGSSQNNTIQNNTANSNGHTGIMLMGSDVTGNTLSGNTTNSNQAGLFIRSSASSNTVSSHTASSNTEAGLYIENANTNTATSLTLSDNKNGVEYGGSAQSNDLVDSTISSSTQADVYTPADAAAALNNNVTNTTFTTLEIAGSGTLNVRYKGRGYVTQDGSPANGATVTFTDTDSTQQASVETGADGYTAYQTLPAYSQTSAGQTSVKNPYTVSASTNLASSSQSANITSVNQTVSFSLASTPLTFYVDATSGNDTTGDGSSSAPYQTIAKALTQVVATRGDTIYATGTFATGVTFTNSHSGASGNPTTLAAWSGQSAPILSGATLAITSASYITISGWTVQNATGHGMQIQSGSNITFQNNTVSGAGQSGIIFDNNSSSNTVSSNTTYNNVNGGGIVSANSGTISGNTSYGNLIGIDVIGYQSPGTTITNNLAYNNTFGIICVSGAKECQAVNNTLHNNSSLSLGFGEDGYTETGSDVARNNIISASAGTAIVVNPNSTTGFTSDYNNIYITGTAITGSYNNVNYSTLANWRTVTGGDANSISQDPLFMNINNADFRLTAQTSPSIDAADPTDTYDLEPQPNGNRRNQGVYGNTAQAARISLIGGTTTDVTAARAIADLALTEAKKDSLVLTWTAPTDNEVDKVDRYVLKYSLEPITSQNFTEALIYEQSWTPADPGIREEKTIENLFEDTTYYFALKSYDYNANLSEISNVLEAKTLDENAPGAARNFEVVEVGTTSVTLNWLEPSDNAEDGTGLVSSYQVKYSLTPIATEEEFTEATSYEYDPEDTAWAPLEGGQKHSVTLTGLKLKEGTTYYFSLKVCDEVPNCSNLVSFSAAVADLTPPQEISDLKAPQITYDSLEISFKESASEDVDHYLLKYSTTPIENDADFEKAKYSKTLDSQEAGKILKVNIEKLTEGTTYYFALKVCDSALNCTKLSPTSLLKVTTLTKPVTIAQVKPTITSVADQEPTPEVATRNVQPTITGTANPQTTVSVIVLDEQSQKKAEEKTQTNEKGNFTHTIEKVLIDGNYLIQITSEGQTSETVSLTVDTSAPETPSLEKVTFSNIKTTPEEDTREVTVTLIGQPLSPAGLEDLDKIIICYQEGDSPIIKNKTLVPQIKSDRSWLVSFNTTLRLETIYFWTQGVDKLGNLKGTLCQKPTEEEETTYYTGGIALPAEETPPQCSDGLDNDEDTLIDYPTDPGCENEDDEDETDLAAGTSLTECSDGLDNDEDGLIDLDDPGCANKEDESESEALDTTPPVTPSLTSLEITATRALPDSPLLEIDLLLAGTNSTDTKEIIIYIESEPYSYTFSPPAEGGWEVTLAVKLEKGNHEAWAVASDEAGNFSAKSTSISFEVLPPPAEVSTLEKIKESVKENPVTKTVLENPSVKLVQETVLDNPVVEEANVSLVAPALVAVAAANTATAFPLVNLLTYLQYLFTQPVLLLARRKRKGWGIVYDALNKKPVDLAIIRLFDRKTNKLVQTKVTDHEGRYQFIVGPGAYFMQVVKPEYNFPTSYLQYKKEDYKYLDLYHGDTIQVTQERGIISPNIPLDPAKQQETSKRIVWGHIFRQAQRVVSFSGVILAIISFIISPILILLGLLLLHILLWLLFRKLSFQVKPKSWGVVRDKLTKKPLVHAVVRIYDTRYDRLLETQVTDSKGRYGFLVGPNEYYLVCEKADYQNQKTESLDLREKSEGTVVAKDLDLVKTKKK